jgi:ribosomal protein L12E/L44/L45/RPP1/RPP2
MNNFILKLELSVDHANTILQHLAKGAYADVKEIIEMIHGQAAPQVAAAAQPPAPAPEAAPAPTQETPTA